MICSSSKFLAFIICVAYCYFTFVHAKQPTDFEAPPFSAINSKIPARHTNSTIDKFSENTFGNYLQISSILYEITKTANENLAGKVCVNDLKHIQKSVIKNELWALKVLDGSATKSSGFIFQQNFWLGSRETCAAASAPLHITLITQGFNARLINDVAPFNTQFVMVYVKQISSWQLKLNMSTEPILHLGLCLPISCSPNEIKSLMSHSLNFQTGEISDYHFDVLYVKDLKLKNDFFGRSSLKMFLIFLIFTIALSLGAPLLRGNINPVPRAQLDEGNEKLRKAEIENHKSQLFRSVTKPADSLLKILTKCFDVKKNINQMFSITKHDQSIPIICGLRSVLSLGVLMAHILFYMIHTIQNLPFTLSHQELDPTQLFSLPFYFVDDFFAISAFLQTFHFLQDAKGIERIRKNSTSQNLQKIWVNFWNRYLRLAPLYLVTMCVGDLMSAYINDVSLFHIYERYDKTCSKYWWRNLLFIQSFYPMKEMCLNWSWSLSCEMLYSIVSSVSLIIYVKNPKSVKFGVLTLLAFTIVWTILKGTSEKFKFGFESFYLAIDNFYMNPLLRGVAFIIGSIAAWYFVTEMRNTKIHPMVEKLLWNLSLLLFFGSAYTMYWRDLDYVTSTCFYLLGRILMALSVSWFIIGGIMGTSTWWSRILEAPIFQHVSRLTYAIYLLNPIIITLFVSLMESSVYVDPFMIILYSCGFWVITYMVSIIFSLMFEVPFHNWSRIILKNYDKKTN